MIVLNILNTNELFNFEWKFDEDSFEIGIPLDPNSYFIARHLEQHSAIGALF